MSALRRLCTDSRLFSRSFTVENATWARYRTSLGPSAPDGPLMMSVGFSSLPAIFLIASSSRVLSYVMSTAIDEGPLDTMPNMSPSCTSSFEIRLNRSRTRPVLWNCRWRSSTKNRKMRPETSLRGRLGGRMIPSGGGGGGGARTLVTRPPVTTVIDEMSCFTPSSKISNSSFLRSGMKLPLSSRTITSLVTRSTVTLKVGFSCAAGGAGGADRAGGCVCADSPTARTTINPVDQKPLVFRVIAPELYIAQGPAGGSGHQECRGGRRHQAADEHDVIRRVSRRFGFARQRQRFPADLAGVCPEQLARDRADARQR